MTRGFLCPRGAKDHVNVATNRILHPHRRGADGKLHQCSWDEALSEVCSALSAARSSSPASVLALMYSGSSGLLSSECTRLWCALDATIPRSTLCLTAGRTALELHYGKSGHSARIEETRGMPLTVWWGFNAAVSAQHIWRHATADPATKVVVIDPRATATSDSGRACLTLRPKPGTDAAVAYAVAARLIRRGAVDEEFVRNGCVGFDEFRQRCLAPDIEPAAAASGLTSEQLDRLAELYATSKPSCTFIGIGIQRTEAGAEAVRVISLIPALLGLRRGFFFANSFPGVDFDYLAMGAGGKFTTSPRPTQTGLGPLLEQGAFKFVFVSCMNPALTLPDQSAVRAGLSRPDTFVCVHESHWTETCEFARVVLPACNFLEKVDLVIPWTHHYVRLTVPVTQPHGESITELELAKRIAGRLGILGAHPQVAEEPESILAGSVRGAFEGIEAGTEMKRLLTGELLPLKQFPVDLYQTPSGKLEFSSSVAKERGASALPRIVAEKTGRRFQLMSSADVMRTHTQFQAVYGKIPTVVHINPTDAESLGIVAGSVVSLENERGQVHLTAVVTDKVQVGTVWTVKELMGLNGQPLNTLTSSTGESLAGGAAFNEARIDIRLISAAAGPQK